MKKLMITIIILFTWLPTTSFGFTQPMMIPAQNKDIPSYAKWGRIAMKETRSKYPQANIVDYLHVGRDVEGKYSVEKFKLWLRTEKREFGVFVHIRFLTETEDIVAITFQETDR